MTDIFTADPSAHVFNGKVYLYPSHDLAVNLPENNDADHFNMADYHVYSMDMACWPPTDHGEVLNIKDVPWASKQMWAPDAAFKNNKYYLFFPARDKSNIFRIGVATSDKPMGPFKAEAEPIAGSGTIDPAVFTDDDGTTYLYVGGLMAGQLDLWQTGTYDAAGKARSGSELALGPRVGKLSADLLSYDGAITEVVINDAAGVPLKASDTTKRFFEGAWVHKYKGVYYLSYSTGDTHLLTWATSTSPMGPFTYKGVLLDKVTSGWTTHHSIVQFDGKWFLFYHDSTCSGDVTQRRCVKIQEFTRTADDGLPVLTP